MTTIEKIQAAVKKYSFTAEDQEDGTILVKNNKREHAAHVKAGEVIQLYKGSKNKCGSLVRNDIRAALEA